MSKGDVPQTLDKLRQALRTAFQGSDFNVRAFLSGFKLSTAVAGIQAVGSLGPQGAQPTVGVYPTAAGTGL